MWDGHDDISETGRRSLQIKKNILLHIFNPGGRAAESVVLLPLPCWDCRFESHCGNGYLSSGRFAVNRQEES